MLEAFMNDHANIWFFIAGLSFVIELSVMGLSGPLLFFAMAAFITALLTHFNVIYSIPIEIFITAILTGLIALVLWKPLKQFQNTKTTTDNSSDMVGIKVKASSIITVDEGTIRYSGLNWQARLSEQANSEQIAPDTTVKIVAINGNIMIVEAIS